MLLIIGSRALLYHLSDELMDKEVNDTDIIATFDEIQNLTNNRKDIINSYPLSDNKWVIITSRDNTKDIYEIEIAWEGSTAEKLLNLVKNDPETIFDGNIMYPSLDVLYSLKMSHRFLKNSPHFLKTREDIRCLRSYNAKIPNRYEEWFKERERETYYYEHPKLNVSKKDFFKDDNISYTYDHDDIHKVVAVNDIPAYENFKIPTEEVLCSKELFDSCDEEIKLNAVFEETMVLALERSQIPFKDKEVDPFWSFKYALIKVCTSITSGWFRDFAWEKFDNVLDMYDNTYVERFWDSVKNGKVKLNKK